MRRRTSTKSRSVTLAVRRRFQWACGESLEGQEFFQIRLQATHCSLGLLSTAGAPSAESADRFAAGAGLINQFGLLQTLPLAAFEFAGHVAQLVRCRATLGQTSSGAAVSPGWPSLLISFSFVARKPRPHSSSSKLRQWASLSDRTTMKSINSR